jgi:hypothetical protein
VDFSSGAYQFADVNSDGLTDIVRADDSARQTFINDGLGWIEESNSLKGNPIANIYF